MPVTGNVVGCCVPGQTLELRTEGPLPDLMALVAESMTTADSVGGLGPGVPPEADFGLQPSSEDQALPKLEGSDPEPHTLHERWVNCQPVLYQQIPARSLQTGPAMHPL